jgi:hypothetical protein
VLLVKYIHILIFYIVQILSSHSLKFQIPDFQLNKRSIPERRRDGEGSRSIGVGDCHAKGPSKKRKRKCNEEKGGWGIMRLVRNMPGQEEIGVRMRKEVRGRGGGRREEERGRSLECQNPGTSHFRRSGLEEKPGSLLEARREEFPRLEPGFIPSS